MPTRSATYPDRYTAHWATQQGVTGSGKPTSGYPPALVVGMWCAPCPAAWTAKNPRVIDLGVFVMERVTRIELALSAWDAAGIWGR
ncbi:hypothetical protein RKD18_004508 [Streptomyces phaeoluteigriseus]